MPTHADYITQLMAKGLYHFTPDQFREENGLTSISAKAALHRLSAKGIIACPHRSFWVVVPPEYRRLGCLPPDQFIPALMDQLGVGYYAGLLSAAQYYGAAHHRPQEFQVVVPKNRRPIVCGSVRVAFAARANALQMPAREFSTPRGTIRVASPETTAMDLVGYEYLSGGIENVAMVLDELAASLDPKVLCDVALSSPVRWAQRLGFLLDQVGADDKTHLLHDHVREFARKATPLIPSSPCADAERSDKWRVIINTKLELEV